MSKDIRYIYLLLIIGLPFALTSCSSEPDPGVSSDASRVEMRFEVAGQTRAVATTNDNIMDQPFMLFGDICPGGVSSVKDSIFHWDEVWYDKEKKQWVYNPAQYWFMGHEHSFVAIHPYLDRDNKDSQVSILTYEDSKLSFTYTLPEKMEDAKDLLFATHRRKYSLDNTGPVNFRFTHLLARINISLALMEDSLMYGYVDERDFINNPYNRNEFIKVNSIEFNGIKTKASFSFTPKPLGEATSTYDYEKSYLIRDDDKVETVVVTLTDANAVINSYGKVVPGQDSEPEPEYASALKADEIIVMLPQTFDNDSDATMVVNYSINDDVDLMRRIVIPLNGTTWKEGTVYTYKFLIDNAYYEHIKDGEITVDIDDFRLDGDKDEHDDSWITDDEDEVHNINYGYNNEGDCGPI